MPKTYVTLMRTLPVQWISTDYMDIDSYVLYTVSGLRRPVNVGNALYTVSLRGTRVSPMRCARI